MPKMTIYKKVCTNEYFFVLFEATGKLSNGDFVVFQDYNGKYWIEEKTTFEKECVVVETTIENEYMKNLTNADNLLVK